MDERLQFVARRRAHGGTVQGVRYLPSWSGFRGQPQTKERFEQWWRAGEPSWRRVEVEGGEFGCWARPIMPPKLQR